MTNSFSKRTWIIGLVVTVIGIVIAGWRLTRAPGIEWLENAPAGSRSRLAFLGKWSQPVRTQLLRAKFWIFGMPPSMTIRGKIVEIDPSRFSDFALPPARFSNASGMQGWIMTNTHAWQDITNAGSVISAPTMSIASGMQGQISITEQVLIGGKTEDVGIRLDLWPELCGEMVRVSSYLVVTEALPSPANPPGDSTGPGRFIRTNAAFGARARLPVGSILFLLCRRTNEQGKLVGALISPGAGP